MNSQNSTKSFEFGAIPGLDILNIKDFIKQTRKSIRVLNKNNEPYTLFLAEDGDLKWHDVANKITRVLDTEMVVREGIRLSPESQIEMSQFLSQVSSGQTSADSRDRFNKLIANTLEPKPEPKHSTQSSAPCSTTKNQDKELAYNLALHIGRGGIIPSELRALRNRDCGDEN